MRINGTEYVWANGSVRKYMLQVMTDRLNNCRLFTDVFGKEFAQKTLHKNIKSVLTDLESKGVLRLL